MRTNKVVMAKLGAWVIEPRRTIVDLVPFVGWVNQYVGKYDPALMPEIAKQWEFLQSGLLLFGTEFDDLIPIEECAN